MSFDTVIFKKSFEPLDTAHWRDVGFRRAKNGRLTLNGEWADMTVFQKGYFGKDWLLVQASLPKILFGQNVKLPTEQEARDAAVWLCGYASAETGLVFTIDDVKAFRIDYTRHYDIREDRTKAILALLPTQIAGFDPAIRKGDSIWFNKQRNGKSQKQIEVYPKFGWAIDKKQPQDTIDESRGKLRLEVRNLRKGLEVIKGATKPLDYLSQSIGDSLLNEAAKMLDLQRIIDARNSDLRGELLVHHRGQRSLGKLGLLGFIELVERYGENFYQRPDFYYPKSTYYKLRSELKKLGWWNQIVAASKVQGVYE